MRKEELIQGVGFLLQKLYALRFFELFFFCRKKRKFSHSKLVRVFGLFESRLNLRLCGRSC